MKKLVYIDDEPQNLFTLKVSLEHLYEVITFENPWEALSYQQNNEIPVLITDQRMPLMNGLELAEIVKKNQPDCIIIILTAYDDQDTLLKAINQGGIFHFFLKPWDINDITQTLAYAFESYELHKKNKQLFYDLQQKNKELEKANQQIFNLNQALKEENVQLKTEFLEKNHNPNIIGNSKPIREVMKQIQMVAKSDSSVMLLGESGTGKELFAQAIHDYSTRKDELIVKINCAAIPDTLLESELFGHEKGAFTHADKLKYGKFELANKGTLFLDEIGEMPIALQPKLLRVLQEKEFERLGGTKPLKLNLRLITATNRDLEKAIENKTFRSDLFYRLNVVPIHIPPLRERKDDIPLLIEHFTQKLNRTSGKKIKNIAKKSMDMLMNYNWPGNVRELENIIERAHVLSEGNQLKIGPWLNAKNENDPENDNIVSLQEMEKKYITNVLKKTQWKIRGPQGAAELLDIKPTTLESKMKKLEIKRPS